MLLYAISFVEIVHFSLTYHRSKIGVYILELHALLGFRFYCYRFCY